MNKALIAALLITGNAVAEERKLYEAIGPDMAYITELAGCTDREKPSELKMCIDAYRAGLADECIIKKDKRFCDFFTEISTNEQFGRLETIIMVLNSKKINSQ